MLFTSNPFLRLDPAPIDGRGLNPILQDPGLAFHPPMLYLGYVGFSIAFSFAVAALIEGRVDATWARWVRPWTLAAWIALTLGIALGSWWAYYELGWGGWWFWDPVENASFMPWLVATALLHSAIVVEKRDTLKSWTILLAILAFSLSLLGTFLVRSGVLTSVHAFADRPRRAASSSWRCSAIAIGGSLRSSPGGRRRCRAAACSRRSRREGGLLLNNLLLATAAATVLLGTLYPLVLDTLGGRKISVGAALLQRHLRAADGAAVPGRAGRLDAGLEARRPAGRRRPAAGGVAGRRGRRRALAAAHRHRAERWPIARHRPRRLGHRAGR